jgi:hypothetical protein
MPDYAAWAAAGKGFGFLDYIHAQALQGRVTPDILGAIVGWLWPVFVEVDGLIILASEVRKLDSLRSQGLPGGEIEYWCNFTNIDGALPGMPVEFTAHLAGVISDMWRVKLQDQFPARAFSVEVIEFREQDELSVTFRQVRRCNDAVPPR